MVHNNSFNSTVSQILIWNNPWVSGAHPGTKPLKYWNRQNCLELPRRFSLAPGPPEPQTITTNSNSNDLIIPYGYGRQDLMIPPILSDLNLPPNPFNILARKVFVPPTVRQCKEKKKAHSHRCRLNLHQFQPHCWLLVLWNNVKRLLTWARSIPMMSPEELPAIQPLSTADTQKAETKTQ